MYIYKIWDSEKKRYTNDYWVNEELVKEEYKKLDKQKFFIHQFLPVFKKVIYDGK